MAIIGGICVLHTYKTHIFQLSNAVLGSFLWQQLRQSLQILILLIVYSYRKAYTDYKHVLNIDKTIEMANQGSSTYCQDHTLSIGHNIKIRSCISYWKKIKLSSIQALCPYEIELLVLRRNQKFTPKLVSYCIQAVIIAFCIGWQNTPWFYLSSWSKYFHISPWKPCDPCIISSQYHLVHGILSYFIQYIIQLSWMKLNTLQFMYRN